MQATILADPYAADSSTYSSSDAGVNKW